MFSSFLDDAYKKKQLKRGQNQQLKFKRITSQEIRLLEIVAVLVISVFCMYFSLLQQRHLL